MAGFAQIRVENGKVVNVPKLEDNGELSKVVADQLEALRVKLTGDFGFPISIEQTIAYMLKQVGFGAHIGTQEMDAECERLMRRGDKIPAIKLVREKTHMGLKEAKDYVESRWQHVYGRTI